MNGTGLRACYEVMQTKSTRAFRTISEAADELELQAHVLRFWESKFPQIQPMKRRGGRRFYRAEDIEFLRGIKILLHREKHPIKDVQKLIRIRGADSVMELGRSVEQAAKPKAVKDTNLVPRRIKAVADRPVVVTAKPAAEAKSVTPDTSNSETGKTIVHDDEIVRRPGLVEHGQPRPGFQSTKPASQEKPAPIHKSPKKSPQDKAQLEDALQRLKSLKSRWQKFI